MQNAINLSMINRFTVFSLIAVLFADIFYSGDIIQRLIGFHSSNLLLAYVVVVLFAKFLFRTIESKVLFQILFLYIGPIIAIGVIYFELLERMMHVNYVYTHFGIIPRELTVFYIYFLILLIVHVDVSFIKDHFKKVLFVSPVYWYPIILLFFYFPSFDAWLKGENKLEELIQFGLFGVSTYFSFKLFNISRKSRKGWKHIPTILYLLLSLALFVITFEEISWGQKLLELEVSENIAQYNTQQELNIHNNKRIFPYVYYGYLLMSGFGAFSWIIPRIFPYMRKKLQKFDLIQFFPPWYLMFFFLFNFIYVVIRKSSSHQTINYFLNVKIFNGVNSIWEWEEHTELLLAIGIFIYIFSMYKVKIMSNRK